MADRPEWTEELAAGLRGLEGLDGFRLDAEPRWCWREEVWAFPCRLRIDVPPGSSFPAETRWWVTLAAIYPQGRVFVYPDDGPERLRGTYAHQRHNGPAIDGRPWRSGDLCLRVDIEALSPVQGRYEPKSPEQRLRWNVERALLWLDRAARGELLRRGDRYELPDFRFGGGPRLGFVETEVSLATWDTSPWWGWLATKQVGKARVAVRFDDPSNSPILTPNWGAMIRGAEDGPEGAWVRLPSAPILEPWEAPSTWAELKSAAGARGSALEDLVLGEIRNRFAGTMRRHPLLLGFPIPATTGGAPRRMHWVGFDLPRFAAASDFIAGFRPGSRRGRDRVDRQRLYGMKPLRWFDSQGWSDEELTGRGRLSERLRQTSVLLLGAGALGSEVAELLIRGGVRRLTVLDPEELEPGNLVRHRLTLDEVGESKGVALARRLNRISPHADVIAAKAEFPQVTETSEEVRDRLDLADLILDTTANDGVQVHLERFRWESCRSFFSLSFGPECRRLYLFAVRAERFPARDFVEAASGWLEADWRKLEGLDPPREGIGCWDPLMPGRGHDVAILATCAVEVIDEVIAGGGPVAEARFVVLEQVREGGRFGGLRRLSGRAPDGVTE